MTRSRPLSMVFGHESGNPLHFNLDPTPKSPTWVAALHRQIRNRGEQGSSGSPAPSVFSDTGRRVVRRRAAAFKSGWKKYGATERRSRSDLYEPRLWITSGLLTIQGLCGLLMRLWRVREEELHIHCEKAESRLVHCTDYSTGRGCE